MRKTRNKPDQDRMSENERIRYFQEMESKFSTLSFTDKHLQVFAKEFLNRMELFDIKDGDTVQLGPMDKKLLEYFIISIALEYRESYKNAQESHPF